MGAAWGAAMVGPLGSSGGHLRPHALVLRPSQGQNREPRPISPLGPTGFGALHSQATSPPPTGRRSGAYVRLRAAPAPPGYHALALQESEKYRGVYTSELQEIATHPEYLARGVGEPPASNNECMNE